MRRRESPSTWGATDTRGSSRRRFVADAPTLVSWLVPVLVGALAMWVLSVAASSVVYPSSPAEFDPDRYRVLSWLAVLVVPAAASALAVGTIRRDLLQRGWWAALAVGVPGPLLVLLVTLITRGARLMGDYGSGMVFSVALSTVVQVVAMVVASLAVGAWRAKNVTPSAGRGTRGL